MRSITNDQLCVHIRWMIRRDMPEVLQIESGGHTLPSVTESVTFPWVEEDFLRCLRHRNCIGMVAEQGECIVGFMVYELHKGRLHILNFAVHPHYRRSGVGTQMVSELVGKLDRPRRARITLEVRKTNLGAQLFFRQEGFRCSRVLPAFYEDSGEDAFQLEYLSGS